MSFEHVTNPLIPLRYCPKCDRNMGITTQLRRKKSKFNEGFYYGCSRYPECRYIENA